MREGEAGPELIPGLAEEVPEPTNGGKTYTFKLRDGLEYSDGSPVKAGDFENTMKRLFPAWKPLDRVLRRGIAGAEEFPAGGELPR